ncbi:TlpA family protein disulfide reductase [Legionella londiniensis]|nr:TlpA disulfide reductase family protein [Legionella londiniensis]
MFKNWLDESMPYFKTILLATSCFFFSSLIQAEIVLHDLQNNKISFSSLQGKWVFLNYWASWCQPCIDEIPELNRFYNKHKHKVVIFGVNYDALPIEEQRLLVRQYDLAYPSLSHDPAASLNLGDIRGVPMTFVFNPEGQLAHTLTGGQTSKTLSRIIRLG